MVAVIALAVAVVVLAAGLELALARPRARRAPRHARPPASGAPRILFPFVAAALSRRALDAALCLARAEDATLLPVFLAQVPRHLPLDAPLPRQAAVAIAIQEAIEQRAAAFGVPVDARVERGRTTRHALRTAIAHERFDRAVVAAATRGAPGLHPDDVAWLLATAPGEIVVVRPGDEDVALDVAPTTGAAARRRVAAVR